MRSYGSYGPRKLGSRVKFGSYSASASRHRLGALSEVGKTFGDTACTRLPRSTGIWDNPTADLGRPSNLPDPRALVLPRRSLSCASCSAPLSGLSCSPQSSCWSFCHLCLPSCRFSSYNLSCCLLSGPCNLSSQVSPCHLSSGFSSCHRLPVPSGFCSLALPCILPSVLPSVSPSVLPSLLHLRWSGGIILLFLLRFLLRFLFRFLGVMHRVVLALGLLTIPLLREFRFISLLGFGSILLLLLGLRLLLFSCSFFFPFSKPFARSARCISGSIEGGLPLASLGARGGSPGSPSRAALCSALSSKGRGRSWFHIHFFMYIRLFVCVCPAYRTISVPSDISIYIYKGCPFGT